MPDERKPRRLIVRDLKRIHSGRTSKGAEYIIWQVIATKPDGTPIDQNLRTFEELPKNEVIEVTVEPYNSEQYGTSYTLKQVGRRSTRDELKALTERVARLEQAVYNGGARAASPQPTPPLAVPPPPPPPPAPAVAPAAPPLERPVPSDDDIPF